MTLKTRLAELLNYMRDELLAFDSHLSEDERDETGMVDAWSARDELVHNVVLAGRMLDNLEAIEAGDPSPQHEYGDIETENRAIFEQYRHASWDEVKGMVSGVYGRFDAYLARASEDDLLAVPEGWEQAVWRRIAADGISHPMFHLLEYLQKRGRAGVLSARFGEQFFAKLLALHDDEGWQGTVCYNLACRYALTGEKDKAVESLAQALRLNPGLVEWSQQDSDLDSIREEAGYKALFGEP